ncbi:MAG: DUF2852 domain-containing protein [Rhodobacteraceae bacterium]|nr:DUF2852 domain-containing protein [Paracoccaceae bacterium]
MSTPMQWLTNSRDWLDGHGKPAWISAMVLGFIFLWPVGLAILFYMIGTNRMGKHSCRSRRRRSFDSTGNTAFDGYRDETLRRLEDEQQAFHGFLNNLRAAKDKAEFDQFMDDRAKQSFEETPAEPAPTAQKSSGTTDFGGSPSFA